MITIYEKGAEDYATIGLGVLAPSECTVEEVAGGLFQLRLTHPMDDRMRWTLLSIGRTIKAPAPVRETPLVQIGDPGSTVTRHIYKVTTRGARLRMRAKPSMSSKIIKSYKPGTEVVRVKVQGDWAQVIIKNGGATGWMWNGNLTFVRDETETTPGTGPGTVIQPRQTGDQLFDIDTIETDGVNRTVAVTAIHISYRLRGNIIKGKYEPKKVAADVAANAAWGMLLNAHDFNLYATVTKNVTGEYSRLSILDAFLDPDQGILAQGEGRLIRDNFDIFLLEDATRNLGVEIRHGKNLLGATMHTDASGVITRIMPIGRKKNGDPLEIAAPGYIDSPYINDYPAIYAKAIEYDVAVGDGENEYTTEALARAELLALAQADFAAGIDMQTVGLDVDFIPLEQAAEYAAYADLQYVHLYDSVRVIDNASGITALVRMTGYTFDSIGKRYQSVTLGTLESVETTIYGYNVHNGSLPGSKLVPGGVKRSNIGYGAVGWPGQIAPGVVDPSHMLPDADRWRAEWFDGLATPLTEAIDGAKTRLDTAENKITDTEGNVSALTDRADLFASDIANAKGDISTIQQNADSLTLAVQGKLDADDPASGVQTSGIDIRPGHVWISTPEFAVNTSGSRGDTIWDEDGLSVPNINSPSVAARYLGPATIYVNKAATDAQVAAGTHFRSLKAALNSLKYKHLGYDVTISMVGLTDYYESGIGFYGLCGGHTLTVECNDSTLVNTFLNIGNCAATIIFDKMRLTQRSITDHGALVMGCQYVRFQNCKFTALDGTSSAYAGVQADRGSNVDVRTSDFYGAWRSFRCNGMSHGLSINNRGNCRLAVDGAIMVAFGTQPCDQATFAYGSANGGIIHQTNVTVDQGSGTTPSQTVTETFAAITMRTMNGTGEWPATWMSNQNYALQGYTDGAKSMYTSIWFSAALSALANKPIKEAKLTLRRITQTGRSGPVKINGYYGELANNAGNGAPSGRVSMGQLGTLEQPQTDTFMIPAAAITFLAGGPAGRCLMLNPKDSALWNGKPYSENHAKFAGIGSAYVPELEVTYVP